MGFGSISEKLDEVSHVSVYFKAEITLVQFSILRVEGTNPGLRICSTQGELTMLNHPAPVRVFLLSFALAGAVAACAATPSADRASTAALAARMGAFLGAIHAGQALAPFMDPDGVELVYEGDNRCYGSFHGRTRLDEPSAADRPIELRMTRDGEGWEEGCAQAGVYRESIDLRKDADIKRCHGEAPAIACDPAALSCSSLCESIALELVFVDRDGVLLVRKIRLESIDPG
jgi:hypothetical protein